eukprot:TRINITY_DN21705_c0_g1_i1.p1 TRINITY_DN21705_c0_g1~~TRINITY_DN21705_c0_g1_i1.p1  ORF type:complete len:208 (-),score=26.97 TRINITY_DN21705_c0_g1_i1:146-769(-)
MVSSRVVEIVIAVGVFVCLALSIDAAPVQPKFPSPSKFYGLVEFPNIPRSDYIVVAFLDAERRLYREDEFNPTAATINYYNSTPPRAWYRVDVSRDEKPVDCTQLPFSLETWGSPNMFVNSTFNGTKELNGFEVIGWTGFIPLETGGFAPYYFAALTSDPTRPYYVQSFYTLSQEKNVLVPYSYTFYRFQSGPIPQDTWNLPAICNN